MMLSDTEKMKNLSEWLDKLKLSGPDYGYIPEPEKSYLVVASDFYEETRVSFCKLGVNVVLYHHFSGSLIGDSIEKRRYIEHKVD